MSGLSYQMMAALSQGVLWGVAVIGVYLTFRILDIADLTVEGSFGLGGAVSAVLITNGMDPYLTLLFALLAGMAAGVITGILHTILKIPAILSGILTMISLYSINIRILGKANKTLLNVSTVDTALSEVLPVTEDISRILIGTLCGAIVIALLYLFFGTELGSAIRATGNNEHMVRALGGNTNVMKVLGLLISNGLVALSGALVAQTQGYADVQMGQGAIVICLASVIIGEVIFCRGERPFWVKLTAVVLGSVIYRIVMAFVLWIGLRSTDLKLITAIIVALLLGIPVIKNTAVALKKKIKNNRAFKAYSEGGNAEIN